MGFESWTFFKFNYFVKDEKWNLIHKLQGLLEKQIVRLSFNPKASCIPVGRAQTSFWKWKFVWNFLNFLSTLKNFCLWSTFSKPFQRSKKKKCNIFGKLVNNVILYISFFRWLTVLYLTRVRILLINSIDP